MVNKGFIKLLEDEYTEFNKSGTSYRKTTACMALKFIQFVDNDSFLEDKNSIKEELIKFSITKDKHRLDDLSKYLHVLYNYQEKNKNTPQYIKDELERRKQLRNGKSIKLTYIPKQNN